LNGLIVIAANEDEIAKFKRHTEDTKWLMKNYDNIRTQYGGEYVAVLNQQIIDHDGDLVKLKKKHPSVVIQYVYKEKPHLIL